MSSQPRPLRAGVIGAGLIAKQHLAAIAEAGFAEAAWVCDLSPAMAESTAERFGLKRWGVDYRRLLDEDRPDAVHIATPPASHAPIALDCLRRGVSVLVEKPATQTLDQLVELQSAAAGHNAWLVEDHNYRFNQSVTQIVEAIEQGRMGAVRHVDVEVNLALFAPGSRFADPDAPHPAMSEPLGVVADFVTHLAYLALLFTGPSRGVSCVFRREHAALPGAISGFQALVDAERATATLGLQTDAAPDAFRLRVQGERMTIETNLFETGVVETTTLGGPQPLAPIRGMLSRGRAERRNAWRSLSRKLSGGPGAYEGLWSLVDLFYRGLRSGGPPPVTAEEVYETNRLVQAITAEAEAPCAC